MNTTDLSVRILRAVQERHGRRARVIARELGVHKSTVNSALYFALRGRVWQDDSHTWWPVLESRDPLCNALEESLRLHPGSTARQLADYVRLMGFPGGLRALNPILYANRGLFWSDGASLPRWWLTSEVAVAPKSVLVAAPAPGGSPLSLYAWQIKPSKPGEPAGGREVVEAVTGSGKTLVGLAAALEHLREGGKVQVLVPSIDCRTSGEGLVEEFPTPVQAGFLGGGNGDRLQDVDILISVVHSARNADTDPVTNALLVADECHRYATERNADARNERTFAARPGPKRNLRTNGRWTLRRAQSFLRRIACYKLDYQCAISDEVMAHFKVALVGVRFSKYEQEEYDIVRLRVEEANG